MKTTSKLKVYYKAIKSKLKVESVDFTNKQKVFECFENTVAPKFNRLVYLEMRGMCSIIR